MEHVSWYQAVYFCNELSELYGLTPCYSISGVIGGIVEWNQSSNGFRLPTESEWEYAAEGGQDFTYSGSDDKEEVGWRQPHEVALIKSNGYGLYDMNGNVSEWCWDLTDRNGRYRVSRIDINNWSSTMVNQQSEYLGFRVVCGVSALPVVSK